MASNFPMLNEQIEQMLWEFEKTINKAIEQKKIEDVELSLRITTADFVSRSNASKLAYSLRTLLDDCYTRGKIDKAKITEEHISIAQSLVKLGRYQKTAIDILSQALLSSNKNESGVSIRKLATEALTACAIELTNERKNDDDFSFDYLTGCKKGQCCYRTGNREMCYGSCNNDESDCPGARRIVD